MKIALVIMLGACLGTGCINRRDCVVILRWPNLASVNNNAPAAIQAEIVSDEFMNLLSRRTGIAAWRIRMASPLAELSNSGGVSYFTRSPSDLLELVQRYTEMRQAGHTKTYAMARLEIEPDQQTIPPDCRAILQEDKEAYLPWLWLYAFKVEGKVNYTSYVILDGDLAWSYVITRRNDRTLVGCYADYSDAKELLPQYRQIFEEVHRQVEAEMKAQKNWDQVGSCHSYWARKKELLKKRGIDWKSPPDLHPNACYD